MRYSWQMTLGILMLLVAAFVSVCTLASLVDPKSMVWFILLPTSFLLAPWFFVGLGLYLFPIRPEPTKRAVSKKPKIETPNLQFKIGTMMWLVIVAAIVSCLASYGYRHPEAWIMIVPTIAFLGPWVLIWIGVFRYPMRADATIAKYDPLE